MKRTFMIFSFLLAVLVQAQGNVGVATVNPKKNLDVNGDLNIRNKVFLDNGSGGLLAGQAGQFLVSQGPGKPPAWRTLRIPEYLTDKYYVIFNDSYSDLNTDPDTNPTPVVGPSGKTGQGVTFADNETATAIIPATDFVVNSPLAILLTKGFKSIGRLTQNFTVSSTISSSYFTFETVVQQNNSGATTGDIKFACGIFVDGSLKSIRLNMLPRSTTANYTFITHTQIGGVENLTLGTHSVGVACARLSTNAGLTLGIGVPATTTVTNLNNFMTQSSLKVDIYEIPQFFSPIFLP